MNDKLKSTLTLVGIPLGGSSSILGLGTTTNDYPQIYASTTNSCKPGIDSTGVSAIIIPFPFLLLETWPLWYLS